MIKYKVLWFDDQYNELESIKDDAILNQIHLNGFSNADEGLKELETNYENYDAVLLDGLFYENKDQKGTDIDDSAFGKVALKLSLLKKEGSYLPWFIFSGQTKFLKGDSPFIKLFVKENAAKGKVFDKNSDKDFNELCKAIKSAVDEKPQNKIRYAHPQVFNIFSNNFLDNDTEKTLIELLQKLNNNNLNEHPKIEFTKLRKIIEKLVDKALQKNLIPSEVGAGNLTEAVGFLCNKSNGYNLTQEYFHPTINFMFPSLLAILQDGSHSKEELRYRVEEFALQQNNGYLFKVCIYQLFDVIIAFNHLFQNHKENNLPETLWEKSKIENLFEGILQKDEGNNYFCGSYLLDYNKFHNIHQPGIKLRILKAIPNNAGRTKHLYPNFAPMFEVIE